jgi:glucosamine-6-phosphate deaminase
MFIIVEESYEKMSEEAAKILAQRIHTKPDIVLGLATGSTPLGLYKQLIQMHKDQGLDFSKVTTFNLDEYVGLSPKHDQSYNYFMWENLFKHVNISPENVFIPMGMSDNIEGFCQWYEQKIVQKGGIDLQLLGIGANGHIAFNEPGSSLGSRTRIKTLTEKTIEDNSRFFENEKDVPIHAITMGVGTIMEAREILLAANGKAKADAIKSTIEGSITAGCPASVLQLHPRSRIVVDKEAASLLEGSYRHIPFEYTSSHFED